MELKQPSKMPDPSKNKKTEKAGLWAQYATFYPVVTAADDIGRATDLARRMIVEFGMSDKLGSVRYAGQQLQYLGGTVEEDTGISPETREQIDREVQRIVTEQYHRAQDLLSSHHEARRTLAQQLLDRETVDGSAVKAALSNDLAAVAVAGGAA